MTEELEFETYLFISINKFEIFLFDKKKLKNLYKEKFSFENNSKNLDLISLTKFLDENIFKIEKLIGKFIKNIFLIIEIRESLNINLGIKKKNYDQLISKKNFENLLIEAKDLFNESFQDNKIMHMLIREYIVGDHSHLSYIDNLRGDSYCLEIQFKSISNDIIFQLDKILEKYQIKISHCIDGEYIKNYFKNEKLELSQMANRIQNGANENEIKLIPKNVAKIGIFEKFFQLFS
tara:strand:- start:326 stop:1030 length:705 start_codon:yes stop_codon:yes gene_type:complete